jgi:hypothetical protein
LRECLVERATGRDEIYRTSSFDEGDEYYADETLCIERGELLGGFFGNGEAISTVPITQVSSSASSVNGLRSRCSEQSCPMNLRSELVRTCSGRSRKLRKVQSSFSLSPSEGSTYRSPVSEAIFSTPRRIFSIHIRGSTYLGPELLNDTLCTKSVARGFANPRLCTLVQAPCGLSDNPNPETTRLREDDSLVKASARP